MTEADRIHFKVVAHVAQFVCYAGIGLGVDITDVGGSSGIVVVEGTLVAPPSPFVEKVE